MDEDNIASSTEFSPSFAADVAKDIGSDLFPGAEGADSASQSDEGAERQDSAAEQPVSEQDPQSTIVPGQNSVGKPLPKSWKKDMAPLWEKADPALHDYVYAREADVMRGIQAYRDTAQQWQTLIEPFAPVLQANPGVDPVGIMQNLMRSHLALINPSTPPAEKAAMAQRLLGEYGIDLSGVEKTPAETQFNDTLRSLHREVNELKGKLTQRERIEHESGVANQTKAVEAFFSDPKNEFAEEVGNDILRFIQTGAANDLPSAYELACYANPAVRAKLIAKQQSALTPVKRKTNGQFINLDAPDADALSRSRKSPSIDATIDGVIAKHFNPTH